MPTFTDLYMAMRGLFAEGGWIFWMLMALAFAIASNCFMIAFFDSRDSEMARRRVMRRIDFCFVLIGVAPLVGLLGTVAGMLQTFSGLAAKSTAAPVETISHGISQALITTQTGLVIAVPAYIFLTLLKRREVNLAALRMTAT